MLVAQSCPTLCDPMDLSGFFVHGILQARILEWVAIPLSRGSSWPRNRTQISCTTGRFFTIWATRKVPMVHSKKRQGAGRVAQKKPMLFFICQATTHYFLFRPTTKLYTLAARYTSLSAFSFLFTNLWKYSQISHFKDTAKSSMGILMMM